MCSYQHFKGCMISGFRLEVAENCALLDYYAVSRGNFLPLTTTSRIITQKRAVHIPKVHCIMKMKAVCLLQNGNCLPVSVAKHPRRFESSRHLSVQNTFHFNKYVVNLIMHVHPYAQNE